MKLIKTTGKIVKRRQGLLITVLALTLAFLVINSYNPLFGLLMGINTITKGDIMHSIISALQILSDPSFIPTVVAIIIGISVIGSLIAGLLFSGFFYMLNNALSGKEKVKGEFRSGVKKYFKRVALISIRIILIGFLLVVFLSIATIPAIVITKAATPQKPELIASAVFVNFLTILVLFFGMMFFKIYALFWYPAAINAQGKYFTAGKKAADLNFWRVVGRFIIFDAVFVLVELIFWKLGDSLITFLANWLFMTGFILLYITYVFFMYRLAHSKQNTTIKLTKK